MANTHLSTPDLTLVLCADGVIQEAIVGSNLADESIGEWIGQLWESTVSDVGPRKVRRLIETARSQRVSGFSQITQRLPSGREILMEFSAVRTGTDQAEIVAIGKNLGLVVEQQQKLIAAQQSIEHNYWKLRDFEARYNAIIKSTSEAVVLIRETNLEIIEANPRARELLGLHRENEAELTLRLGADTDTDRIRNILSETRSSGQAPSTLVHLNQGREQYRVRATAINGAQDLLFLLQFVRVDLRPVTTPRLVNGSRPSLLIVDTDGIVLMASNSFAELIGIEDTSALVGDNVGTWLEAVDIREFSAESTGHDLDARLLSKDGHSWPITVSVNPLTSAKKSGLALTIELSTPVLNIH